MKLTRRKALAGIGMGAVASGAVFGSGAFSLVEANRDLEITIAEDDTDAMLELKPTPDSANADKYVDVEGGVLSIDLSGIDDAGINQGANVRFRSLFDITNQGSDNVFVWVEQDSGFGIATDNIGEDRPDTTLSLGDQPANAPLGHPEPEKLLLQPGESMTDVALFTGNSDELDPDEDEITISAATADEIYFANLGEYAEVDQFDTPDDDDDYDEDDLLAAQDDW